MSALDGTAATIDELVVALNEIQTLLGAEQSSIDTARGELLARLGATTDPQVLRAAQSTIKTVRCLTEAADHLRSAVASARAFAAELGLPPVQLQSSDTLPIQDSTHVRVATTHTASGQTHNLTNEDTDTYNGQAGNTPAFAQNADPVPSVSTSISRQRQGRHVRGDPLHTSTGKSYFSSHADAQNVLDAYHNGSATVLGLTSNGNIVVVCGNVTGYNNNPGAGFIDQPTNIFMIKGARSPSVVPINPKWTP